MKATALADKISIEAETPSDVATINLITRGKVCMLGSGIGTDAKGVRIATMTIGRWDDAPDSSKDEELRLTNQRNASLEHILDAIPPCPAHGAGCIPHALEWIQSAKLMEAANGTTN